MFKMPKISLLIFSINEVKEVISLSKSLQDYVDEIVTIDSSTTSNFMLLKKEKQKSRLKKLKLFHAPALGYAEPFRSYGISKCRNEWVFLLDTDERPSSALLENLHGIVSHTTANVFKLKRYESVQKDGKHGKYFTWQVRLFRKNSVEFLGLTHETPRMSGKVTKLLSRTQYLEHLDELRHQRHYNKMDLFSPHGTAKLIVRDILIGSLNGEMSARYFSDTISNHLQLHGQRDKDAFGIAKIIHRKGVIKYLGLEKEATIRLLDKKYKNKPQGVELLIKLLKDRYNNKYP